MREASVFRAVRMTGLFVTLVATQLSGIGRAESVVGNNSTVGWHDGVTGEGVFRHLRAF